MSDSLWLHGLQHARLPCPSPTPRAYSNSCSLSQCCHPAISSSVIPFFSRLQSFSASGSFQMSRFFPSSGQSIGVSASTSVLPMNIQDWFPLGWTGWISLQSKGLSRSSSTPEFRSINSSVLSFLYGLTLTSIHDTGKTIALTRQTFVGKVMSLLFNVLSSLVIPFLPKGKRPLISWLLSPSAVILKVKSLSRVRLFATPWTVAYQASPSIGFSRQGHWSGLPFPSPGDLPDPGIKPGSPAL